LIILNIIFILFKLIIVLKINNNNNMLKFKKKKKKKKKIKNNNNNKIKLLPFLNHLVKKVVVHNLELVNLGMMKFLNFENID